MSVSIKLFLESEKDKSKSHALSRIPNLLHIIQTFAHSDLPTLNKQTYRQLCTQTYKKAVSQLEPD
jgi:hypothetical protein